MPSITFDLETVTPLFLSGADQTTAELRPPAFRGALRYWFRLIAAPYFKSVKDLQNAESICLGSTDSGSRISIRLTKFPEKLHDQEFWTSQDANPGLHYLFFSTRMQKRKAIGVSNPVSFSLKISTQPQSHCQEYAEDLSIVIASCFWFAVNIGGFGSRERRGGGSLRVKRVKCDGIDTSKISRFDIRFRPEVIPRYLKAELRKSCQNFVESLSRILGSELSLVEKNSLPSSIEVYSKRQTAIYLLPERHENWEDALEHIGNAYKTYRQSLKLRKRTVFGLPLKGVNMEDRHPSPLRFKVLQSVNDFYILLIKMKSDFPSLEKYPDLDYQLVDDFIGSFREDKIMRVG